MATQDGVTAAVDDLVDRWGRLDVVVANAGLSTPGTIETLDDASWERMRSINLDGLIRLARTSVPRLRESRGCFLAISSIAGLGGDWNQAGYNATKGAVNALVQSMALDLGREGVRVNAIAPAFTATRQTQERLDDPAFWSALRDRLALDRAANPEDVARAALFLASPDAALHHRCRTPGGRRHDRVGGYTETDHRLSRWSPSSTLTCTFRARLPLSTDSYLRSLAVQRSTPSAPDRIPLRTRRQTRSPAWSSTRSVLRGASGDPTFSLTLDHSNFDRVTGANLLQLLT